MKILSRFTKRGLIVCLSIYVVFLFGNSVFAQGKGSDPLELTFAVLPQEVSAMSAEMYQPLINYIAEKTGKKVAFYMTTSYAAEVEAMIGGFIDIARLGPTSYVIGRDRDPNIEVFAVQYAAPGIVAKGGSGYYGCLVTAKGGKYDSIEKLRGTILALTDPQSTSGYLVPKVFFPEEKLGGEPLEKYFGKIVFVGMHDAAMLAVHEGRVDAAFTNDSNMERLIAKGVIKKESFNFLWWSKEIVGDAFAWRKNLKSELKEKIKEAFLTFLPGKVKGADKFMKDSAILRYAEAQDNIYDPVRKLLEAQKKMKK